MNRQPIIPTRILRRTDEPGQAVCNRVATIFGRLLAQFNGYAWIQWEGQESVGPVTERCSDIWVPLYRPTDK